LNLVKGRITFTKNGSTQTTFDDIKRGNSLGEQFIPAFALDKGAKLNVNFGDKPFKHMPEGYYPLHWNLGTEDRAVLETLFDNYTSKQHIIESDTKSGSSDYSSSSESEHSEVDEEAERDAENVIQPSLRGTMRYLSDLNIDMGADFTSFLLISWKLNVKKAFYFTREEFVIGWSVAGCKSLEQMKDKIAEWKVSIKADQFTPFYKYCYKFFLNKKSNGVLAGDAIKVWDFVIKDPNWVFF